MGYCMLFPLCPGEQANTRGGLEGSTHAQSARLPSHTCLSFGSSPSHCDVAYSMRT